MLAVLVTYIAAMILLGHYLLALNAMPNRGQWCRRGAYVLVCVGSFCFLADPDAFDTVNWGIAALVAGHALVVTANHWKYFQARPVGDVKT